MQATEVIGLHLLISAAILLAARLLRREGLPHGDEWIGFLFLRWPMLGVLLYGAHAAIAGAGE
jgi:hypothetical protein